MDEEQEEVEVEETQTDEKDSVESTETQEQDEKTLLGDSQEENPEAPEKYEFKVPEGMELNEQLVEGISPVLKDIGLSQEQAQKLVDAYAPIVKQQAEAQDKANIEVWTKQVAQWGEETKKELGADYKKELSYASKFINQFGGDELRKALDETGFGNHPLLTKALVQAGKVISNDSFADPKTNNTNSDKMGMDALTYPSMQTT